jgi:hypothetical protein
LISHLKKIKLHVLQAYTGATLAAGNIINYEEKELRFAWSNISNRCMKGLIHSKEYSAISMRRANYKINTVR